MIFFKKQKTKQNIEEAPINALPEYTIRTMSDDMAKLGLGESKKEIKPPETLPIVETIKKAPLPKAEEFIAPTPKPVIPITPTVPITPKPIIPKPIIPEPKKIININPIVPKPIIPKAEITNIERPKKKIRISKKFIIRLIIILIAVAIGAFFYWQGQKPQPLPQPKPESPQPGQSLIIIDETKILKLLPGQQLIDLIKEEADKNQEAKTLKRLAVLKNDTEFLLLADIIKELNIIIAPYALSELKDDYTLVVYAQNDKRHLGIITKVENENNLKEQLRFWEKTMGNDLQNLFISEKPGSPITTNFQNNTYKNIAIRYINFPKPELTIDYAVSNGLFILTTSREAIYKIIDNFNQ